MNSRLSVLHGITKDFIQRQGPDLLAKLLPPKVEHVILLHMAPVQSRAYQEYIKVGHLWPAAACRMWSLCRVVPVWDGIKGATSSFNWSGLDPCQQVTSKCASLAPSMFLARLDWPRGCCPVDLCCKQLLLHSMLTGAG